MNESAFFDWLTVWQAIGVERLWNCYGSMHNPRLNHYFLIPHCTFDMHILLL